ncbi:MAG: hypothetical protein ACUVUQ_11470 [Thermodesulfovibrionales bacterium]
MYKRSFDVKRVELVELDGFLEAKQIPLCSVSSCEKRAKYYTYVVANVRGLINEEMLLILALCDKHYHEKLFQRPVEGDGKR